VSLFQYCVKYRREVTWRSIDDLDYFRERGFLGLSISKLTAKFINDLLWIG
jgi:hypothetical protein